LRWKVRINRDEKRTFTKGSKSGFDFIRISTINVEFIDRVWNPGGKKIADIIQN